MSSALNLLFSVVIWGLVPALLAWCVFFFGRLYQRVDDLRHRYTARSGFWAGVMLFLVVIIYQIGQLREAGFPENDIYQGFDLWFALASGVLGYLFLSGGRHIISPRLMGWFVMFMTFAPLWMLVHYLFIRSYNATLLSLVLGMTFGILAHLAASPSSIRDLLKY